MLTFHMSNWHILLPRLISTLTGYHISTGKTVLLEWLICSYPLWIGLSLFQTCLYFCLEKMLLYWSVDQYNNVWKRVVEKGVARKGLMLRKDYWKSSAFKWIWNSNVQNSIPQCILNRESEDRTCEIKVFTVLYSDLLLTVQNWSIILM